MPRHRSPNACAKQTLAQTNTRCESSGTRSSAAQWCICVLCYACAPFVCAIDAGNIIIIIAALHESVHVPGAVNGIKCVCVRARLHTTNTHTHTRRAQSTRPFPPPPILHTHAHTGSSNACSARVHDQGGRIKSGDNLETAHKHKHTHTQQCARASDGHFTPPCGAAAAAVFRSVLLWNVCVWAKRSSATAAVFVREQLGPKRALSENTGTVALRRSHNAHDGRQPSGAFVDERFAIESLNGFALRARVNWFNRFLGVRGA